MQTSEIRRKTGETEIYIQVSLTETGAEPNRSIQTGVGFFDHMLDLFAFHAGLDLTVEANGDLEVDGHHTVEDVAIALGMALQEGLGDKKGIARYASSYVPLNEALGRVVVDYCGRGQLIFNAQFGAATVGEFDTELCEEFFRSYADSARATIHADLIRGTNVHHCIEVLFKSLGRSTGEAIRAHAFLGAVASTKGVL